MVVGGLVLFGVASLVGTLADSAATLIAVRAVMGLGGAFIMPLGIAILPSLFAPAERPRDNPQKQHKRADHSGARGGDFHHLRQNNDHPRTHDHGDAERGHLK